MVATLLRSTTKTAEMAPEACGCGWCGTNPVAIDDADFGRICADCYPRAVAEAEGTDGSDPDEESGRCYGV